MAIAVRVPPEIFQSRHLCLKDMHAQIMTIIFHSWFQIFNLKRSIQSFRHIPFGEKSKICFHRNKYFFSKLQWFVDMSFCKFMSFHPIYFTNKWFPTQGALPPTFASWRIFLIVYGVTIVPDPEATSKANSRALRKGFSEDSFMMALLCRVLSFLGRSVRRLFYIRKPLSGI